MVWEKFKRTFYDTESPQITEKVIIWASFEMRKPTFWGLPSSFFNLPYVSLDYIFVSIHFSDGIFKGFSKNLHCFYPIYDIPLNLAKMDTKNLPD